MASGEAWSNPYAAQAEAFSTALRLGQPMPIPPSDSIANLEVIESILATAATGRTESRR